jgi:2-polyprenyl-6-methoxyphenol hydroxylase-like FAD-dependent oxidoreductase
MDAAPVKTQVAIIGAGPTGLSLAAQLIRYGISFIILEKNEKTTPLSKAVVIQARTLEIFDEIGLASRAISRGRTTMALNMFYKGKHRAHLDLNGLGNGQSAFPFVLSLEQSKTEELLVEFLAENGQSVKWQSEFTHFDQDSDGVTIHYKDAETREHIIKASYIVGCDGAGSLVRHKAGMSFEGDTIPKIFYVADVTLKSPVINKDELFIFLIPKGFILFFPMEGDGHYRVIGILPEMTSEQAESFTFEDIRESVEKQLQIQIAFTEIRWFSHYKVHSRKAETFRNGRSFIAGDAAHIHTPAGGQGMNTGIQDAYNLAWKLAMELQHHASEDLIETYNTERMENAKHLLHTTDRMFDFMAGTGWLSNFVRLNIFPLLAGFLSKNPNVNRFLFPLVSQIGITYPHSALTIESKIGKVAAGDRMHFFTFSDGRNIFDFLKSAGFKVLYFGNEQADFSTFGKLPFEVRTHSFTEIPKPLFGDSTGFYILLRPDNHICFIGKEPRKAILKLAELFGNNIQKP